MRIMIFNILSYLIMKVCNHPTFLYMDCGIAGNKKFCPNCGKMLSKEE